MNKCSLICTMRAKDEQKIDAIYNATLSLTQQMGFGGITMARIARDAGIATGTLYIYFKNKEELINSLYLHLKRKKARSFIADMDFDKPLKVVLKQMFTMMLKGAVSESAEMAFLEQYHRSPYIDEAVQTEAMQLFQPFFDIIERGQKEFLIKDVKMDLIMAYLSGSMHEFAALIQDHRMPLNENTFDLMFNMVWDGLKT